MQNTPVPPMNSSKIPSTPPVTTGAPTAQKNNDQLLRKLLMVLGVLIVVAMIFAGFVFLKFTQSKPINNQMMGDNQGNSSGNKMTACTMEAKQCPDGSYVGRTGPNCEFALCPSEVSPAPTLAPSNQTQNWQVFSKEAWGFSIKYPPQYQVLSENNQTVEFGMDGVSYITITTNVNFYDEENLCKAEASTYPCIDSSTGWGQTEPVAAVQLGTKEARSFYLVAEGSDNVHHVVVVQNIPGIELSANVAGAKLDDVFQKMLSTVTLK